MTVGLIFRAEAPFHWAGKTYQTDDEIDATGWSAEAIRQFTKRCPVYVDKTPPIPTSPFVTSLAPGQGARTTVLGSVMNNRISGFGNWCAARGVPGYVAEVGIPVIPRANASTYAWFGERGRWEALLELMLSRMNYYKLNWTYWDVHERGLTGAPNLSAYVSSPTGDYTDPLVDGPPNTPTPAAMVIERHFKAGRALNTDPPLARGVVYSMGAYGAQIGWANPSTFSNTRSQATFAVDAPLSVTKYNYGSLATYTYLASRNVKTVRLNFRFERLFRNSTPANPVIDATEMQHLKDAIGWANSVGIKIILTSTQNGVFYIDNGSAGIPNELGSANYTGAMYAAMWGKMAQALAGVPGVFGYHIENEVNGAGALPMATWDAAAQLAVTAIRGYDMARWIMVPLLQSSMQAPEIAGNGFINDPANHFMYEAHNYPDGTGAFTSSYDTIQANAVGDATQAPYACPDDFYDLRAQVMTLRQSNLGAYFAYDRDDAAHHAKRGAFYVQGGKLRFWSEESAQDVLVVDGASGQLTGKGGLVLPGATVVDWRAAAAPANVAGAALAAFYAGIAGFTVVAGHRYEMQLRLKGYNSASVAGSNQIYVCLGNATGGAVILELLVPATGTGSQTYRGFGTFLGGTDVPAGAQTFTIEGIGAATNNFTVNYTAGQWFSNAQLLIKDIGT